MNNKFKGKVTGLSRYSERSSNIKIKYAFDAFRQGQKEVISKILRGESVGAKFPTGAGKSLLLTATATKEVAQDMKKKFAIEDEYYVNIQISFLP